MAKLGDTGEDVLAYVPPAQVTKDQIEITLPPSHATATPLLPTPAWQEEASLR